MPLKSSLAKISCYFCWIIAIIGLMFMSTSTLFKNTKAGDALIVIGTFVSGSAIVLAWMFAGISANTEVLFEEE